MPPGTVEPDAPVPAPLAEAVVDDSAQVAPAATAPGSVIPAEAATAGTEEQPPPVPA